VVNNVEEIYRYKNGAWLKMQGTALDIGAGPEGTVLAVGDPSVNFCVSSSFCVDRRRDLMKYDYDRGVFRVLNRPSSSTVSVGTDGRPLVITDEGRIVWPDVACEGNT
jgi:hypothetical protein